MPTQIVAKHLLTKTKPRVAFPRDLRLSDHVREVRDERKANGRVYEFIGSDTFGTEWSERRRYEVNAGREEEPILYPPIYSEIRDANLPKNLDIFRIGPGGVVLEEVYEGGEVKFASITTSEITVRMHHYGVGLEYSKDLVVYNELWSAPIVERQLGIAYNALLNHIHLSPILTYSYTGANQTAFNTGGSTTVEDFMLTIEDAIANSRADTSNPRRGPYILLVNSSNLFTIEKALTRVPQEGVTLQSRAMDAVTSVVAYDGWTGARGAKSTTYAGVTANKAYLIDTANRVQDFQSFIKQDLMEEGSEEDISRFMTQVVWDTYFTVYANPVAAVEEISFS